MIEQTHQPEVSKSASSRTAVTGLASMWIAGVTTLGGLLYALVTPMSCESAPTNIFVALIVWIAVFIVAAGMWSKSIAHVLGIGLISFSGLLILFKIESEVIVWWYFQYPSPRPRFHNNYFLDERNTVPNWKYGTVLSDRFGNAMLVDYFDNLRVLATEKARAQCAFEFEVESDEQRPGWLPGWNVDQSDAKPNSAKKSVVIPRMRDKLLVVADDGTFKEVAIGSDSNQQLTANEYYMFMSNCEYSKSLAEFVRSRTTPIEKEKFDEILSSLGIESNHDNSAP